MHTHHKPHPTTWNLQSNSNTNRAKHGARRNFDTWQHHNSCWRHSCRAPKVEQWQIPRSTQAGRRAAPPCNHDRRGSQRRQVRYHGNTQCTCSTAEPLDPDDPRIECTRCQAAGTSDIFRPPALDLPWQPTTSPTTYGPTTTQTRMAHHGQNHWGERLQPDSFFNIC